MREIEIQGQKVKVDPQKKRVLVHIREPFLTAGKQLCWDKKHKQIGLGINKEIVKYAYKRFFDLEIAVASNKKSYLIAPADVLQFSSKNKSYWRAKRATLCVIPWGLATPLEPQGGENE